MLGWSLHSFSVGGDGGNSEARGQRGVDRFDAVETMMAMALAE